MVSAIIEQRDKSCLMRTTTVGLHCEGEQIFCLRTLKINGLEELAPNEKVAKNCLFLMSNVGLETF